MKIMMTYLDLSLRPSTQLCDRFELGCVFKEGGDPLHILLQLNDELGDYWRDVVPLVRGVLQLAVD